MTTMKLFGMRNLNHAIEYARSGGQALHVMDHSGGVYRDAPECFRRTKMFAHLFDQDLARLTRTARRLGVRIVKVSREGQPGQHVDLCGRPMRRAISECEAE